jgi:hypothetical protein
LLTGATGISAWVRRRATSTLADPSGQRGRCAANAIPGRVPSTPQPERVRRKEMTMNISDIMTREPITITPQATIAEAHLMLQHRVSGLPIPKCQ